MKRYSLRVAEGLARRRHGNRLKRDFNAQVPIPARTGNVDSGKMRRASAPLLVTMRRGFLLPRQMAGAQCSAPFKKTTGRAAAPPGEPTSYGKKRWFHESAQVPRMRSRISARRHARVRI